MCGQKVSMIHVGGETKVNTWPLPSISISWTGFHGLRFAGIFNGMRPGPPPLPKKKKNYIIWAQFEKTTLVYVGLNVFESPSSDSIIRDSVLVLYFLYRGWQYCTRHTSLAPHVTQQQPPVQPSPPPTIIVIKTASVTTLSPPTSLPTHHEYNFLH